VQTFSRAKYIVVVVVVVVVVVFIKYDTLEKIAF